MSNTPTATDDDNLPPGALGILLSIQRHVGETRGDMRAVKDHLARLDPVVWRLERERVEQDGLKKGVARYVTAGRTAWAAGGSAVVVFIAHWFGFLPR